MSYTKNETLDKELLALQDILSFCKGRMELDIDKASLAAYRDVKYLVRQHINILNTNKKVDFLDDCLLKLKDKDLGILGKASIIQIEELIEELKNRN